MKKSILLSLFAVTTALTAQTVFAQNVVHITKRNAQNFAMDGDRGAENGQSIYLFSEDSNNVNQQWIEIDRGNGFYSYQKQGTNHCIDGGRGGADRQDVYLWACSTGNQNQHWRKVATDSGFVQLRKRNAQGFAIDGGSRGRNRQNVALYNSSNRSQNLQWRIESVRGDNNGGGSGDNNGGGNSGNNGGNNNLPDGVHEDITRIADIDRRMIVRNPGGEGWKDSYSVGDRCYCDTTFDHDIGDIRVNTPLGRISVREACEALGDGPGSRGRPIYNDIQCGNGPANDAGDEEYCPGRVDIGRDGCTQIGPRWNFN